MPNCHNTVGEHKSNKSKQVCSSHRKQRKDEVDAFKLQSGCANSDGLRYGFACVCSNIFHPATLDINHIDGNNLNRDPANIEVLCKMCHTVVTLNQEHHLQTKKSTRRVKVVNNGIFEIV